MNRWLIASIALLVALSAFLWLAGSERDGKRGESPVAPEALDSPRAEESTVPAQAPSTAPTLPELVAPEAAPTARESNAGVSADELARAVWVEGRVLFPEGTPLDEAATVEARGKKFDGDLLHDAKVAADGRFRVAFKEGSKTGWIALSARYAILEKPYRWKKSDPAPIVLTPELGGRIAGKLKLPEGALEGPGGRVTCSTVSMNLDTVYLMGGLPMIELGRGLEFDLGGLPPGGLRLHYEGEKFWAPDVTRTIERGVTNRVELELRRGADLAGRAVEANGAPLAGVQIRALSFFEGQSTDRTVESAVDGSFRFRAIPPPSVRLTSQLAGYVDVQLSLDGLQEGEVREGLVLVFGAGTSLSGRVTWPDGLPARAQLTVRLETSPDFRVEGVPFRIEGPNKGLVETDADGRFHVAGLDKGTFSVHAVGMREGAAGGNGVVARAEARGVTDGKQGLELVLQECPVLAGRVTDERGAPIVNATIAMGPGERETAAFGDVHTATTDRDGAFEVQGLDNGRWRVEVSRDGYVTARAPEVDIPAAAPLKIVLLHGASVSGLVLDEQGAPVPRAIVSADGKQGGGAIKFADPRGAFELAGLPEGRVTLSARAQGFAAGEPLELELGARESRRNVVVNLRRGGRIVGEVLDEAGAPVGGAWVYAGDGTTDSTQCSPDGHFEIAELLPGEVQVTAMNADTGLRLSAQVTVVAGETAHVRLQKPESFVHLHGIVRVAGDPAAGANISSQERETKQPGPWCRSTEDGSYALELPRPGAYWIGVGPADGGAHLWLAVDVPRCSDFAHDLELSLGRVSGRVRAQDGSPLSGVRVEAKQTSDKTSASGWGKATTDDRGEYELVLPAATYELAAGGDGGDTDPARSFARTALAEVVVVNRSRLRGIDFELAEGGTLEGVVHWGDGSPGVDAELWIGPQGKSVESTSLGKADAHGRFRVEGVGAGKVMVTATLGLGTAEWQKLEVKPGSVQTVELTLAASEALEIRVLDRGTPVAAEVRAVDEKGKDYGSVTDAGPIARIGPLPAGRYRVTAHLGERTASAEVTLTGKQETSKLEIVLP